jgi:hypothetical protein
MHNMEIAFKQCKRRADAPLNIQAGLIIDQPNKPSTPPGIFRIPTDNELTPLLNWLSQMAGIDVIAIAPVATIEKAEETVRMLQKAIHSRVTVGEFVAALIYHGVCYVNSIDMCMLFEMFTRDLFKYDIAPVAFPERHTNNRATYVATSMTADSKCALRADKNAATHLAVQGIYPIKNVEKRCVEWWGMTKLGMRIASTQEDWGNELVRIHEGIRASIDDAVELVCTYGFSVPVHDQVVYSCHVSMVHLNAMSFDGKITPVYL